MSGSNLEDDFEENTAAYYLQKYQKQLDADGVEVGVSRQALDEVLTDYKRALNALADDWISVDVMLPENNKQVLAYFKTGTSRISWYQAQRGFVQITYDKFHSQPTHWKPITPPTQDEVEG